jgi:hypothetical protein
LGDLHFFLGIEVKKIHDGLLFISRKICNWFSYQGWHEDVHHVSNTSSLTEGSPLGPEDITLYRSIVVLYNAWLWYDLISLSQSRKFVNIFMLLQLIIGQLQNVFWDIFKVH